MRVPALVAPRFALHMLAVPTLVVPMLAVLVLLAGCGKKGSPSAPGPASEISYPRNYPSR